MVNFFEKFFPYLVGQLSLANAMAVLGNFIIFLYLTQLPLDDPELLPKKIVPLAGCYLLVNFGGKLPLYFQNLHFSAQNAA